LLVRHGRKIKKYKDREGERQRQKRWERDKEIQIEIKIERDIFCKHEKVSLIQREIQKHNIKEDTLVRGR